MKYFEFSIHNKMQDKNSSPNSKCDDFEVEFIPGYPNGIKKRDNLYLPLFTKNLYKVKELELRKDDYFSNGYPKTGLFFKSIKTKFNLKYCPFQI